MPATGQGGWPMPRSHRTPKSQTKFWTGIWEFFMLTGAAAFIALVTMTVHAYDTYLDDKPLGNVFFAALIGLVIDACVIVVRIIREVSK